MVFLPGVPFERVAYCFLVAILVGPPAIGTRSDPIHGQSLRSPRVKNSPVGGPPPGSREPGCWAGDASARSGMLDTIPCLIIGDTRVNTAAKLSESETRQS